MTDALFVMGFILRRSSDPVASSSREVDNTSTAIAETQTRWSFFAASPSANLFPASFPVFADATAPSDDDEDDV